MKPKHDLEMSQRSSDKRMRGKRTLGHALAILSMLCATTCTLQAQSLTWLGSLWSDGFDVSDNGSVAVGDFVTWGPTHAFRWQSGVMQDLGTLQGGNESRARGVSSDGSVVVGWSAVGGGYYANYRGFRWKNGTMISLGVLALSGRGDSYAYGVSSNGLFAVGAASTTDPFDPAHGYLGPHACRWNQSGGVQDLGTLANQLGDVSSAYAVSADGSVVVGKSQDASLAWRAFRWTQSGGMQNLGTLGGNSSAANGVSNDGTTVVGVSTNSSNQSHAFRWTQPGGMQDLGTLGGNVSQAFGASGNGLVVVGGSKNASNQDRAFRWATGVMEDLNQTYSFLLSNGSVMYIARAISPDARYIVGWGWNGATGHEEGFLLDTVPEPATLLALGAGLAGFAMRRRRKA